MDNSMNFLKSKFAGTHNNLHFEYFNKISCLFGEQNNIIFLSIMLMMEVYRMLFHAILYIQLWLILNFLTALVCLYYNVQDTTINRHCTLYVGKKDIRIVCLTTLAGGILIIKSYLGCMSIFDLIIIGYGMYRTLHNMLLVL